MNPHPSSPQASSPISERIVVVRGRKVILDFTQPESGSQHIEIQNWTHEDMPALFVDKVNHGTILSDPPPELVGAVVGMATAGLNGPRCATGICRN